MPIAGTNISLDSAEGMDKISQTEKVTSPYFSNGTTTLAHDNIRTSSLTNTNQNYFFGISHKDTLTTEEFNIAFGSTNGYGSLKETNTKAETEAIYKKYASMLLAPTEVTGGFIISSPGSSGVVAGTGKDQEIYVMSARRSNMKDRLNKGTWTITLSGSSPAGASVPKLELTDDSVNENPTASPVGDRYNIVSGAAGTGKDQEIYVMSARRSNMKFRDEEDQVSAQYFCRVRSGQMNFSNNPTFVSGSLNELRQKTMKGNPTTFISSVQLYNDAGEMVAVGNLSTPLKKNFSSEATIKVKLTY